MRLGPCSEKFLGETALFSPACFEQHNHAGPYITGIWLKICCNDSASCLFVTEIKPQARRMKMIQRKCINGLGIWKEMKGCIDVCAGVGH